jgi:hypothetical protein
MKYLFPAFIFLFAANCFAQTQSDYSIRQLKNGSFIKFFLYKLMTAK